MKNLDKVFDEIFELENDSCNGGGKRFPRKNFEVCKTIAKELIVEPLVFDTSIQTIMFQFEKDNKYMEIGFAINDKIYRVLGFTIIEDKIQNYDFSKDTVNEINLILAKHFR